ncbi:MAG: M14 family zinc carboxypeptidase [Eubacteriales bacterium]|nr:M14 family zinc carboxypeptidase [Eubacteriales bacterium]
MIVAIANTAMAASNEYYERLDKGPYMSTGGTAQGSMNINPDIPDGCYNACALEVPDPIVGVPEMYTYDILTEDINKLKARYGDRMSVEVIGKTHDNRNIYDIIIGNRYSGTRIMINGAIHGREYITSNLCMKQLEFILWASDGGAFDGKSIESWLNKVSFHFIPMINPDGVTISQFGPDGIRDEALRQTVLQAQVDDSTYGAIPGNYFTRWKANARGVNLNCNFDIRWSEQDFDRPTPSYSYYKGPYATSENETRALTDLCNNLHFKAVINYHSTGSVLYWDLRESRLREHSRDLANNIKALTGYSMIDSDDGGGYNDYLKCKNNPTASVSVEVGTLPAPNPASEMGTIWAQNKFVPLYTMKWASEKGV